MDERFLRAKVQEMRQWLEDNRGGEVTYEAIMDALVAECGRQPDGSCLEAGSEHCDFDCPFSPVHEETP
jgi:hypothetical protein